MESCFPTLLLRFKSTAQRTTVVLKILNCLYAWIQLNFQWIQKWCTTGSLSFLCIKARVLRKPKLLFNNWTSLFLQQNRCSHGSRCTVCVNKNLTSFFFNCEHHAIKMTSFLLRREFQKCSYHVLFSSFPLLIQTYLAVILRLSRSQFSLGCVQPWPFRTRKARRRN